MCDIAMSPNHPTLLRFPETLYRALKQLARRRRTTLAALVRESVERYLGGGATVPGVAFGDDPADSIVGSVGSPARDESVNHDHYLYGWPKEKSHEGARGHQRT